MCDCFLSSCLIIKKIALLFIKGTSSHILEYHHFVQKKILVLTNCEKLPLLGNHNFKSALQEYFFSGKVNVGNDITNF